MSSYHILNSIWFGIFPMLIAGIIIGIICYLLCCFKRIKLKCKEQNQRKSINTQQKHVFHSKETKSSNKSSKLENLKDPLNQMSSSLSYEFNKEFNSELNNSQNKYNNHIKLGSSLNEQPLYDKKNSKTEITTLGSWNSLKAKEKSLPSSYLPNRSALKLYLNKDTQFAPHKETDLDEMIHNSINKNDLPKNNPKKAQFEQLVVQELKESPKSIYSRLQTLARIGKFNKSHKSGIKNLKSDSDNSAVIIDLDRPINRIGNFRPTSRSPSPISNEENTNENKKENDKNISPSSSNKQLNQDESSSSCSYGITNTSSNRTSQNSSIISLDGIERDETSKQKPMNLICKVTKNFKMSKNDKKKAKKTAQQVLSSSSPTQNSAVTVIEVTKSKVKRANKSSNSLNSNGSKSRALPFSKSKLLSEIELEEDMIFNDGDDSLSSTGICATGKINATSQHTLVNAISTKSLTSSLDEKQRPPLISQLPDRNSFIGSLSSDTHLKMAKINPNLINSSSLSDIDPDDNILKNLLVKSSKRF